MLEEDDDDNDKDPRNQSNKSFSSNTIALGVWHMMVSFLFFGWIRDHLAPHKQRKAITSGERSS